MTELPDKTIKLTHNTIIHTHILAKFLTPPRKEIKKKKKDTHEKNRTGDTGLR